MVPGCIDTKRRGSGIRMVRKELTISLDEDLIEEMVEIAESRSLTLSTLLRDVIGSFCRSYRTGTDWTLHGTGIHRQGDTPATGVPLPIEPDHLAQRLDQHEQRIAELFHRVTRLEQDSPLSGTPRATQVPLFPPADADLPGERVIDSDEFTRSGLSDEALVKIPKHPVLPVIDAVEYGGSRTVREEKEYTLTEAAAILGLSSGTLRKYVKENRISGRKVSRAWFIPGREILAFLASQRN